ncbi:cation transporter [Formicincola oecophyllae]|uniref:Cation transporter n=2 Tax=Formicincola oecophyllae TaxID=2558361 RepID=A0A4Y6UA88_9PROT|nr:cation transporter [Formicincola oecophyllae]
MALGGLLVAVLCLAIKVVAWLVSGSGALLSDALETVLNVLAAAGALAAVHIASQPPDEQHPYGHGKAEYLWAVMEGTLISLTALGIAWGALHEALHLEAPAAPWRGALINALAVVLTLLWLCFLNRAGKRQKSAALLAEAAHLKSDVWASGALLLGVALIPVTHWLWLDPLLSAAVALNTLWTGGKMIQESCNSLMDESPRPEVVNAVRQAIQAHGTEALSAHNLRMRHGGSQLFIELHLVVPGPMSVTRAHSICDRIENAIQHSVGPSSIWIHVEPDTAMAKGAAARVRSGELPINPRTTAKAPQG